MDERWLSYKKIIDLFGISKQTLYNWRRKGIIEYKKITYKTYLYKIPIEINIKNGKKI